jgi:hypothetical protein
MRVITRTLVLSALSLAVASTLLAQRGGGARAAAPSGGHAFSSPRVGTAPFGTVAPASGYTGIRAGALRAPYGAVRSYGLAGRNSRRGPYAYFYAPYYYPYLGYSDFAYSNYGYDPGYGYDAASDPNAQGALMAENMLGDQINRLGADVDQLKYGQPPAPQQPQEDPQPPQAPVTLVLRNGQQLQVQNYAVMDQIFWDFSAQPTRKIPIANIDIAASAKATMANGADFPDLSPIQRDSQ